MYDWFFCEKQKTAVRRSLKGTLMDILKAILSSTVLVAIIAGAFGVIKAIITNNNKAFRNENEHLRKENEELKAKTEQLQQTISEQAAAIKDLRDQAAQYNVNQQDSGYSDYINWET